MLAVEARLQIQSDRYRLRVDGAGQNITCTFEGNMLDLLAAFRGSRQLVAGARAFVPFLVRAGLRIDIVAGTIRIGQAGRGVRQNIVTRALRLPAVRLGL